MQEQSTNGLLHPETHQPIRAKAKEVPVQEEVKPVEEAKPAAKSKKKPA